MSEGKMRNRFRNGVAVRIVIGIAVSVIGGFSGTQTSRLQGIHPEIPVVTSQTFTVTSTNDSGAGTLRQAILDANGNPGADTIAFNISGTGAKSIFLQSVLPTITEAVT